MKVVKTAIIPVAGYGTRRLPITKAIEKCMLPIHDRPAVDFVVEDCVAAGIEHIIFVVGEQSSQLHTYYGHNHKLEQYLQERGKTSELEAVRSTGRGLKFTYVVQPQNGAYGTAVPVHLAAQHLGEEQYFAVMMGDDFVFRADGGSELKDALAGFQEAGSEHLMLSAKVPREQAQHYGVLQVGKDGCLRGIAEKPTLDQVPASAAINISKFVFSRRFLPLLEKYISEPHTNGEEYYLTDVLLRAVEAGQRVAVHPVHGEYLDVGSADAWLKANNIVAQA